MIRVRTEPRVEPITLAEARLWLQMTDDNDTDQDAEVLLLVKAMRRYAEKFTGRRFVDQELELCLDCWPGRAIELPVAPIVSIDYVKYLDQSGDLQTHYDDTGSPTVGADLVQIDTLGRRIQPAWGETWPYLRGGDFNAVQIGFTAGYGTGGSPEDLSLIPAELKVWIRARIATCFEMRETIIVGNIVNELPRAAYDALLDPLMLGRRIG
jgi:uncharacterized phiE125 gp8 family phage protein